MTQDREALAAEALRKAKTCTLTTEVRDLVNRALAALAQQEAAEPAGFHDKDQPEGIAWCPGYPDKLRDITPLYTTPPAPQHAGAAAWQQGFAAGVAWKESTNEFWRTHDYGQPPKEPSNPYTTTATQRSNAGEAERALDMLRQATKIAQHGGDFEPCLRECERAIRALSTQQQEQAS